MTNLYAELHPEYVRGHVAGYEQCKADHNIPDEPQPARVRVLPESPREAATSAEGALREWIGQHVWADDDFGGWDEDTYRQLLDLVAPDWRRWTWQGRQDAEPR